MPQEIRGRLAPTPSGYLHLGNACNFLLTWLLVRRAGGSLRLRIDDADAGRSRPEFIDDIFRQLEWLGLDWDLGPVGPDDFAARYSQLKRLERYRELLRKLSERELVFPCTCSRKQIQALSPNGLYPGTCRQHRLPPTETDRLCRNFPAASTSLRVRCNPEWGIILSAGSSLALPPGNLADPTRPAVALAEAESHASGSAGGGEERQPLWPAATMGDFVIWRRDRLPAYQLASLADDLADGTNLVVRGRDLLASSAAQLFLAHSLGGIGRQFLQAAFLHHPLCPAADGRKLSKSDRDLSLAAMRSQGVQPVTIYRQAAAFLGLPPAEIGNLADLQALFQRHPLNPGPPRYQEL